jgi:hypothetical protein
VWNKYLGMRHATYSPGMKHTFNKSCIISEKYVVPPRISRSIIHCSVHRLSLRGRDRNMYIGMRGNDLSFLIGMLSNIIFRSPIGSCQLAQRKLGAMAAAIQER